MWEEQRNQKGQGQGSEWKGGMLLGSEQIEYVSILIYSYNIVTYNKESLIEAC